MNSLIIIERRERFNGYYIAGYGDAQRYIKSFNKVDYILYYSMGIGIIAIRKRKALIKLK